jgi:hypothetical protein
MGHYVKQTSSQEPLDGLEPCLAEMLLTRSCTLNYDLPLAAILDFRSAKQVTTLG